MSAASKACQQLVKSVSADGLVKRDDVLALGALHLEYEALSY
jgi:hypothetical protein